MVAQEYCNTVEYCQIPPNTIWELALMRKQCETKSIDTNESDSRSYEATKAVAKKPRKTSESNPRSPSYLVDALPTEIKPRWKQVKCEFNLYPLYEENEMMCIWYKSSIKQDWHSPVYSDLLEYALMHYLGYCNFQIATHMRPT